MFYSKKIRSVNDLRVLPATRKRERENTRAGYRMNEKYKYSEKSKRVQYLHFS